MHRPVCALIAVAVAFFATEQNRTDATAEDEPAGPSAVDLNGHRFTLPDGFTIDLVANYPLVYRPVAAAYDHDGRLYVADSAGAGASGRGRLVRLDPARPDGRVLSGQVVAESPARPPALRVRTRAGFRQVAADALARNGPAPTECHRYESPAFGPAYLDNLFRARFDAAKVTRQTSESTAAESDFLVSDNPDFHPTDVTEDADGSLIVVDTGGWGDPFDPAPRPGKADLLGAIYRVRKTGSHKVPDPRGLTLDWTVGAEELARRLADERVAVRHRAVEQLGRANPADAVGPAARVLAESPASRVRLAAVGALDRIDHPHARAAVRSATADPDPAVRQAAAEAIGAAGTHLPSATP